MSGKGSAPRPFDVPREVYESNHEAIFGKRERKVWVPPPPPLKDNNKESLNIDNKK